MWKVVFSSKHLVAFNPFRPPSDPLISTEKKFYEDLIESWADSLIESFVVTLQGHAQLDAVGEALRTTNGVRSVQIDYCWSHLPWTGDMRPEKAVVAILSNPRIVGLSLKSFNYEYFPRNMLHDALMGSRLVNLELRGGLGRTPSIVYEIERVVDTHPTL